MEYYGPGPDFQNIDGSLQRLDPIQDALEKN